MTDHDNDPDRKPTPDEIHEQFVDTIAKAIGQLVQRYAAAGMTHEAGIEGAQKGALSLALQAGMSLPEAAQMFRSFADAADLAEGERDPTVPQKH